MRDQINMNMNIVELSLLAMPETVTAQMTDKEPGHILQPTIIPHCFY